MEQIASTLRDSYNANAKELKGILNKNGNVNNDELNRITRKVLSGDAAIQSPFFGDKTAKSPESRRIIEATLIGRGFRSSDSGDVRSTRSKESEQTTKQELVFVKFNLSLNKTNDGKHFLSLSEPGSLYKGLAERNLQRQGHTSDNNNNRRSVRAIWTKYKNLQFKGTTKIKNAEDVA